MAFWNARVSECDKFKCIHFAPGEIVLKDLACVCLYTQCRQSTRMDLNFFA